MKADTVPLPFLVIIDTNVWISAALSRDGIPARLVRHVLERGKPVFSVDTFAELETRLWKPKFDRYLNIELRQRIVHDLSAVAHWVDVPDDVAARGYSRDSDDDKFIHAALVAQALWLVTGDEDLLSITLDLPVTILSPVQAMQTEAFLKP